jgi:hypothetical protein
VSTIRTAKLRFTGRNPTSAAFCGKIKKLSATGTTANRKEELEVTSFPFDDSSDIPERISVTFPANCSGGLMVSVARALGGITNVPLPTLVPALRMDPSGTLLNVADSSSAPFAVLLSTSMTFSPVRGITVSSGPTISVGTVTSGGSASAVRVIV